MTEFRNAYHFVPRRGPTQETLLSLPESQRGFGLTPETVALGHAVYAKGTHSGRITCRITLETPMAIGALRHKQTRNHTVVEPFMFNGRPAVPATSIKGVISSIAESASMAPFRVLENMKLSVRPSGRNSARITAGSPGAKLGRTHDYFPADSLPSAMSRHQVHLVESMFGFVRMEGSNGEKPGKSGVVAVAGKLRFSDALPSGEFARQSVTGFFLRGDYVPTIGSFEKGISLSRLKEQSQPMKQPPNYPDLRSATPNFYFRRKSNPDAYIDKADFGARPARDFEPQGGKFYLHNPEARTGEPWKTADKRQSHGDLERKAAAAPIKAGTQFEFRVDFDNLTTRELELLCFALRPSEVFRHKIGLGKALGLGSIRIDILKCALVDRQIRYAPENVFSPDPRVDDSNDAGFDAAAASESHGRWLKGEDPDAFNALMAIGETHVFGAANKDAEIPVLWVPLTDEKYAVLGQPQSEDKSYAWFMNNEKSGRQKLESIRRRDFVPTLGTKTRPVRNDVKAGGGARPGAAPTQTATPVSRRVELAEGERTGKLKFYKRGPNQTYFGYLEPDSGAGDVRIEEEVGAKADLHTLHVHKGVRVAFFAKKDEKGNLIATVIRRI